jgi:hypothetical protein
MQVNKGIAMMKTSTMAGMLILAATVVSGQEMPSDYSSVLKTLGKQGDYKADVLKINIPRNDLKVSIDGVATPTPFGFGGWLATFRCKIEGAEARKGESRGHGSDLNSQFAK